MAPWRSQLANETSPPRRRGAPLGPWLLAGGLLLLAGCGGGRSALYPVSGTVTYQGQPVANAQVLFTPAGGRPAQAVTDAEGRFQLMTYAPGDGAVAGRHRVTIVCMVGEPPTDANPYPEARNILPARYALAETSELAVDVARGLAPLTFALED